MKKYLRKSASDFMPHNKKAKRVLLERAHQLAKSEVSKSQNENLTQYIRFKLGQQEFYGINYEKIKEVMRNLHVTSVPHVPSFIAGVINRRGALIAVIDLKNFFQIATGEEEDKNQYIIIVNSKKTIAGILVDNIEGNDFYNPALLDAPIVSQSIAADFILGIHKGSTTIINVDTILADSHLLGNAKTEIMK